MKLHNRLFRAAFLSLSGLLLFSSNAYAVRLDDEARFPWFKNFQSVGSLISLLLPNALLFAGVSLFIMILVMGFRIMQSGGGGDAEGMAKGKRALTYAIAGFVLIFSAYFIIQMIEFMTDIKIFNPVLE